MCEENMKYKKAAYLLRIKIAERLNEIENEINSLKEKLIALNQKASLLEREVAGALNVDEEIGKKIANWMKQKAAIEESLASTEENTVENDQLKYKIIQIDHYINQLNEKILTTKVNANKVKKDYENIKLDIIENKERLKKLELRKADKISDLTNVEENEGTDEPVVGSTLAKNIKNNVKVLSKTIIDEEKKLYGMLSRKIHTEVMKNPEKYNKVYDIIHHPLSSRSPKNKESFREAHYNRQLNEAISAVTDNNDDVKNAQNKIAKLKHEKKVGANAEAERVVIESEIATAEEQRKRLNLDDIFQKYFKKYRDYFVPAIAKSLTNHIKTEIKQNPDYSKQFFYVDDDKETIAINEPRILNPDDFKSKENLIRIDNEKIKEVVEANLRGELNSNFNKFQSAIIKETLPVFSDSVEAKKASERAFVDYFFNPIAVKKVVGEIRMPANEIIAITSSNIRTYIQPIKEETNQLDEVFEKPNTLNKLLKGERQIIEDDKKEDGIGRVHVKKDFGYTILKALLGDAQSVEKLKEYVKSLYFGLWDDNFEFNVWKQDIYLGEQFLKTYNSYNEITGALRKQIEVLEREVKDKKEKIKNLEKKLSGKLDPKEISRIKKDIEMIKNEIAELNINLPIESKKINEEITKIKAQRTLKLQKLFDINEQQQEALLRLTGKGSTIEEPIGGRTVSAEPRVALRLSMDFFPNYKAIFRASLSSSENTDRDAGLLEFEINKIGKKQYPNRGNIKITLNKEATQPVFVVEEDEKTKQPKKTINNVGQSSNIKSSLLKILSQLKQENPKLTNKELIKENKSDIIDKIKRIIFGKNYHVLVEKKYKNVKTGKIVKGRPDYQNVVKSYEEEIAKQLAVMGIEKR